ncbi:MAG: hypothetical protein HWN81_00855 [Candidatus Lokiarchaeota archaeon]|nr:hypothetical protein [Candidatus Lokiarchaeota archaeon]
MKNPKKDFNIKLSIYFTFFIIALLSSVFPFTTYSDEHFSYKILGYLVYMYGTYEGLILISISIIFLIKLRVTMSLGFGFCGCIVILFSIILFISPGYWMDIGAYILIFALTGFFLLNFSLFRVKKYIIPQLIFKKNEVRDYIMKLPSIYSQITLNQIMKNLHLKKQFLIDLNSLIEEMISKNELEGELNRDSLVLKKAIEKRPITEVMEPETKYKKRLFGMIRLRKEIDINEAAQFLQIEPHLIEELLYDLAGEKSIQGTFQGSRFIIESDIDQFINVLDHSFYRWEASQSKNKIE